MLIPRYGEGRVERLPDLARELVSLNVDVIVVNTDPAIVAANCPARLTRGWRP